MSKRNYMHIEELLPETEALMQEGIGRNPETVEKLPPDLKRTQAASLTSVL